MHFRQLFEEAKLEAKREFGDEYGPLHSFATLNNMI